MEDIKKDRCVNYDRIMDVDTVTLSDCENLCSSGGIVVEINEGRIVGFYMKRGDKKYKEDLHYKRNGEMWKGYIC